MSGVHIQTSGLTVRFGQRTALDDVTVDIAPGSIHGLLGRNGAGKTTWMAAVASLRKPPSGSVFLNGAEPFEHAHWASEVCMIRESGDLLEDSKLKHNLDFQELARPSFDRAYAEELLDSFGVHLKDKPKNLSRGQRSAVGAAIGLASRAPLTMFDEVHLGMDAVARQKFYDALLAAYAIQPRTFVLSSHLIAEVEHLLESVTILHNGKVLLSSDLDELRLRGVTITGPADEVAAAVRGYQVIGRRQLGRTSQVTVFGEHRDSLDELARQGLELSGIPLQDLFIHLTDDDRESSDV